MNHPETGLHYIHVISDLKEISDRYVTRYPWMSVLNCNTKTAADVIKSAPADHFFICWYQDDPGPREGRKAKVVTVYNEAIGRADHMLPEHVSVFDAFVQKASGFDAVLTHTPWMTNKLSKAAGLPAYVFPLGYCERTFGAPDFERSKVYNYIYYGSAAGKRPALTKFFAPLVQSPGSYWGKDLTQVLNSSRAILYVAHSDVISFSTWRTWHAAASSAALVAEVADCWPMIPWTHFIPIPRITEANKQAIKDELQWLLNNVDLVSIAERMHGLGREYTTDACIEKYLIPASKEIANR